MAIDPVKHAIMLAVSLICGVILAVFYELLGGCTYFGILLSLRFKKRQINKVFKTVSLFFKDLFFCFVIGCMLVLVIYITNDGEFRFMAPAGMAIGFIVGYKTLGHLVRYCVTLVSNILFKALLLILRPFVLFGRKFKEKLIDRLLHRISSCLHVTGDQLSNNSVGKKGKNGKKKKKNIHNTQKSIDGIGVSIGDRDLHWNIH